MDTDVRLPRQLYHLAEADNWPSIERHGLLSTRALLERAGLHGAERARFENQWRPGRVALPDGAVVRDQKPMPPAALERCLREVTPAAWYALLNERVFFWLDIERLNRMRRAYVELPQVVMTVDAARLLARHAARVALTPINTGNARRFPAPRGPHTFVPYETWLRLGWASETEALGTRPRPRGHPPVELTVADAVPDALDLVTDVRHLGPGELFHPTD